MTRVDLTLSLGNTTVAADYPWRSRQQPQQQRGLKNNGNTTWYDDDNEGNDGSNANSDHDLDYAEADYIYSSGGRRMLPDGERAMIQVGVLL